MDTGKGAHPEEDAFGQIFMAWIKDTHENPTRENFLRLQEVMDKGCSDKQFVMRSQRLGVNSAMTIARLLDRTPIEKIDLYENVIRDHGVQALSQLIRDSRSLTHLNVGGNDIGPLGCAYLAALVPMNKKLKYLILGSDDGDMHMNRIDSEAGKSLADGLSKNKTVKWLDLNRNPLGQDTQDVFFAFAKVLETSKTMTTLKLGGTMMNTASAVCMVRSLLLNQSLEFLDLHDNDLQSAVGEALAEVVLNKNLKSTATLQTVLIHNNPKLRSKGLMPFFRALKEDAVMTTLNLANTSIGDEGTIVLAETLHKNQTLTHLDLTNNDISEEGAIAICGALKTNNGVHFLGLSSNKIRDEGACALASTLEVNHVLTHLELGSARLSDRGTIALGVALALNMGLQYLKLNNNHISDAAGKAFAELIEKNYKLLSVDFRGNQVSHSTLLRVKKITKKNKGLRDGDAPNQLQHEVIRLHFQQYKLQEANSELKDHQKARLELQEQADRTERDAMTENENTAKRSKEIIEKILLVENFIQDLHVKRKHKEEETGKNSQQFEQDLKALQEQFKRDTHTREEKQKESDAIEVKYRTMVSEREDRMKDLSERIAKSQTDREAWLGKNKIYRTHATSAQEQSHLLEAQIQEKQAQFAAEREAKAAKKEVKKKKGDANDLIDNLLGA
jgi:Ran GTPase-activating protein (RanGAP) involved in mRNA processing and transport